jgi:hypothetical protein
MTSLILCIVTSLRSKFIHGRSKHVSSIISTVPRRVIYCAAQGARENILRNRRSKKCKTAFAALPVSFFTYMLLQSKLKPATFLQSLLIKQGYDRGTSSWGKKPAAKKMNKNREVRRPRSDLHTHERKTERGWAGVQFAMRNLSRKPPAIPIRPAHLQPPRRLPYSGDELLPWAVGHNCAVAIAVPSPACGDDRRRICGGTRSPWEASGGCVAVAGTLQRCCLLGGVDSMRGVGARAPSKQRS